MAIDLESLLKLGASLPMEDKLALVAELARLAQQDARDQSFGFETAAVYDSFHGPSVTDPSGTTTHARNATQLVCPPAFHMDHLSHGVMTHYGLARADVLKITMDDKDSTDPAIRSDMIHSALAKYAAGELVRFIKQGDVKCVATGSGRGAALTCLYIAMALKDKSPNEWFHHLTVLPLTGYIGASPWSHWPLEVFGAEPLPKGLELDAWCAAESLARVSWHSRIYRLALPVVLPTEISKSTASQFANANGLPISVEG